MKENDNLLDTWPDQEVIMIADILIGHDMKNNPAWEKFGKDKSKEFYMGMMTALMNVGVMFDRPNGKIYTEAAVRSMALCVAKIIADKDKEG